MIGSSSNSIDDGLATLYPAYTSFPYPNLRHLFPGFVPIIVTHLLLDNRVKVMRIEEVNARLCSPCVHHSSMSTRNEHSGSSRLISHNLRVLYGLFRYPFPLSVDGVTMTPSARDELPYTRTYLNS